MKYFLGIFAIIIYFHISSINTTIDICQHFIINKTNNKCKLKSFTLRHFKTSTCICSDLINTRISFTNSTLKNLSNLKDRNWQFTIYYRIKKRIILDKKQLENFNQDFINIPKIPKKFLFRYIKGFDVNSSFNTPISLNSDSYFYFYESSLVFYSNGRPLKTCQDFRQQPKSIFQMLITNNPSSDYVIQFQGIKYQPVCPLAFSNTLFSGNLNLFSLCNTFYKTNIPTFLDLPNNITQINSSIKSLYLSGYGGISLSRRIINPHVFNRTIFFYFYTEISGIEKSLFKSFRYLKTIFMNFDLWKKLYRNEIDWMYDLNANVRVDFNDSAMIRRFFSNGSFLTIWCTPSYRDILDTVKPYIPDEDFCVYGKFPFEQMVFWFFENSIINATKVSCAFVWLVQPRKNLLNNIYYTRPVLEIYRRIYDVCDFKQR